MKSLTFYRPLLWLAAAMAGLAVVSVIGAIVDPREVGGVNLWFKPLKFALSIGIYCISLAWVIGLLGDRRRRLANIVGTVSVIGLVIEVIIIVGAAIFGLASHFNVSTPFHSALWSIMAVSIVVVWMMALIVTFSLFRTDLGDRARTIAIRAGAVIAVVGMGLAFLMTSPSAQQLADFQGVAGAHAVGIADGGPGLPVLGWSTVAGDLRIPHFIGMHALQVFPLLVIALERLVRSGVVRARLIVVAVVTYAATIAVLTWQSLSGQSIIHPSGAILVAGVAITIGAVVACVLAVALPRRAKDATITAHAAKTAS